MEKKLLDILVCPNCKGKLVYNEAQQKLICRFDKLMYPIREGIPVMLIDEATRLTDDEV